MGISREDALAAARKPFRHARTQGKPAENREFRAGVNGL